MIKKNGYLLLFLFGCFMLLVFASTIGYDPGMELGILFIFPIHIAINAITPLIFLFLSIRFNSRHVFFLTAIFIIYINFSLVKSYSRKTPDDYEKMYNVDSTLLDDYYLKDKDSQKEKLLYEFKKHFSTKLHCNLIFNDVKFIYSTDMSKAINSVNDTIIVYTISNIVLNKQKNTALYFITYLDFLNIHANDSLPSKLKSHSMASAAIAVSLDKELNWIDHNIALDYQGDTSYRLMNIDNSDIRIIDSQQDCIKRVIVDYDFIKNPSSFWGKLMTKKYWDYKEECKTTTNTIFTHFRASWFVLVCSPFASPLRGIQPSSSLPKKA